MMSGEVRLTFAPDGRPVFVPVRLSRRHDDDVLPPCFPAEEWDDDGGMLAFLDDGELGEDEDVDGQTLDLFAAEVGYGPLDGEVHRDVVSPPLKVVHSPSSHRPLKRRFTHELSREEKGKQRAPAAVEFGSRWPGTVEMLTVTVHVPPAVHIGVNPGSGSGPASVERGSRPVVVERCSHGGGAPAVTEKRKGFFYETPVAVGDAEGGLVERGSHPSGSDRFGAVELGSRLAGDGHVAPVVTNSMDHTKTAIEPSSRQNTSKAHDAYFVPVERSSRTTHWSVSTQQRPPSAPLGGRDRRSGVLSESQSVSRLPERSGSCKVPSLRASRRSGLWQVKPTARTGGAPRLDEVAAPRNENRDEVAPLRESEVFLPRGKHVSELAPVLIMGLASLDFDPNGPIEAGLQPASKALADFEDSILLCEVAQIQPRPMKIDLGTKLEVFRPDLSLEIIPDSYLGIERAIGPPELTIDNPTGLPNLSTSCAIGPPNLSTSCATRPPNLSTTCAAGPPILSTTCATGPSDTGQSKLFYLDQVRSDQEEFSAGVREKFEEATTSVKRSLMFLGPQGCDILVHSPVAEDQASSVT